MPNFGFMPDPQHVEAATLGASTTPDNPRGAVGRPQSPPPQASDDEPAGEPASGGPTPATTPAAPSNVAPAPSSVALPNFGFVPDPESEKVKWSRYLQSIGVNKDRADKMAATMDDRGVPAFPNDAADQEQQQREIETGAGLKGAGLAASIVGGEVAGGALAGMSAARAASQLRALNAARDTRHIEAIAEAVSPGRWNTPVGKAGETVGSRVTKLLAEDAEQSGRAVPKGGQPPWTSLERGQLPRAPQDMTSIRPPGPTAGPTPKASATALLKNPIFWSTIGGGVGGAGVYHTVRSLQFLGRVFGE